MAVTNFLDPMILRYEPIGSYTWLLAKKINVAQLGLGKIVRVHTKLNGDL